MCGTCRGNVLPRITFIVQWYGKEDTPLSCKCAWNGHNLSMCTPCGITCYQGDLIQAAEAKGWQIVKYYYPLRFLQPKALGITVGAPNVGTSLYPSLISDPTAPPLEEG